jgi:sugar fermentation stimulation protein A
VGPPQRARSRRAACWRRSHDLLHGRVSYPAVRLPTLVSGTFVRRDNRFRATVLVDGVPRPARVASSGRMAELLVPGSQVWLAPATAAYRRTAFDLLLVEHKGALVSVDAHLPNRLWAEHLRAWGWHGNSAENLAAEQRYGESRLDFSLTGPNARTWMEVKSVTLVVDGWALFPDAPTARGTRHVRELAHAVSHGDQGVVIFVVQRSDAIAFAPNVGADPLLAEALLDAHSQGVLVEAYACRVSLDDVVIDHALPVSLTRDTPRL